MGDAAGGWRSLGSLDFDSAPPFDPNLYEGPGGGGPTSGGPHPPQGGSSGGSNTPPVDDAQAAAALGGANALLDVAGIKHNAPVFRTDTEIHAYSVQYVNTNNWIRIVNWERNHPRYEYVCHRFDCYTIDHGRGPGADIAFFAIGAGLGGGMVIGLEGLAGIAALEAERGGEDIAALAEGGAGLTEAATAASRIIHATQLAELGAQEGTVVLGHYTMPILMGGRQVAIQDTLFILERAARLLGGRTLSSLPGTMSAIAPALQSATRIVFFTSPNMQGLTAAEMALIQSDPALLAKSVFVYGGF